VPGDDQTVPARDRLAFIKILSNLKHRGKKKARGPQDGAHQDSRKNRARLDIRVSIIPMLQRARRVGSCVSCARTAGRSSGLDKVGMADREARALHSACLRDAPRPSRFVHRPPPRAAAKTTTLYKARCTRSTIRSARSSRFEDPVEYQLKGNQPDPGQRGRRGLTFRTRACRAILRP